VITTTATTTEEDLTQTMADSHGGDHGRAIGYEDGGKMGSCIEEFARQLGIGAAEEEVI